MATTAEGEVRIRYVADRTAFDGEVKAMQAASDTAVKAMGTQAKAVGDQASATVVAATAKITEAERKLAAEIRAADSAIKARANSLGLTVTQLRKYDRQLADSAKATVVADKATGQLRATTQNLNAQIFDIGAQLSTGTNPFIILSQQGPQIAQALQGADNAAAALRASLLSMVKVIGPIAAAVGTAYVAWRIYSEETTRAKETNALLKVAFDSMLPSMRAIEDQTIRLRVATGDLTTQEGALLTAAVQAHRSYQSATAQTTSDLAKLRMEQGSVKTQLVDLAEDVLGITDPLNVWSYALDALTTSSDELQGQIDQLARAQDSAIGILRTQVDITQEVIVEEEKRKDGLKSTTEAMKAAADAEKKLMEEREQAMNALRDSLAELLGIVVEAERAFDFMAESAQWASESLTGGITPAMIKEWGALSDAVDAAVPAAALSRADQLRLLLLDLELAASQSGKAADALAEDIARVQAAIGAADEERGAALLAEQMEQARDAAREFRDVLSQAAGVASKIGGSIMGVIDTLTGGALSTILSPSALIGEAGNAEGGGESAGRAIVQAAMTFVQTVIAELPSMLDALAGGIPHIIDAVIKGIPEIVGAFVDALPGLVQSIAEKLPKLLIVLAEQIPVLLTAIVEQLPTLVLAIVDAIPTIIQALVKGLPALFDAIFAAIPEIIIGIVEALPDIIAAILEAIPVIVVSLIDAIFTELIPRIPEIAFAVIKSMIAIVGELIQAAVDNFVALFTDIIPDLAKAFGQGIKQALGLGKKDKEDRNGFLGLGKIFGDTPGPVKVGMEGLTARFSPGDVVVAARTTDAARAQLGPSQRAPQPVAAQQPAGQSPRLDISDGHVVFDGLFRRNIQSGGSLSGLRKSPAHVEVYRR